MHRETGYKKLQKTYIPTDIYQRYLLVMLGKNKPKMRGNMKEVQLSPRASQRIFKELLQHLFKFKKRLC